MKRFLVATILVVALTLGLAQVAQADPPPSPTNVQVHFKSQDTFSSPLSPGEVGTIAHDIHFLVSWDQSTDGTIVIGTIESPFYINDPNWYGRGTWYAVAAYPASLGSVEITMTPFLNYGYDYQYSCSAWFLRDGLLSNPVYIYGIEITQTPQPVQALKTNLNGTGTGTLSWLNYTNGTLTNLHSPGQGGPIGTLVVALGQDGVVPSSPATTGVPWQVKEVDGQSTNTTMTMTSGHWQNAAVWRIFEGTTSLVTRARTPLLVPTSTSLTAPKRARHTRYFVATGYVKPTIAGVLTISKWYLKKGHWVKGASTVRSVSGGKYGILVKLGTKGKWRLRAQFKPRFTSQAKPSSSVYRYTTAY